MAKVNSWKELTLREKNGVDFPPRCLSVQQAMMNYPMPQANSNLKIIKKCSCCILPKNDQVQ